MRNTLPDTPNLEYLKKQAKKLQRRHRARDRSVCDSIRHFEFSFSASSDSELFDSNFSINQAQTVIAREFGFRSWARLKRYVERCNSRRNNTLYEVISDLNAEVLEHYRVTKTNSNREAKREALIKRSRQTADLLNSLIDQYGWPDASQIGHNGACNALMVVTNSPYSSQINLRAIELLESLEPNADTSLQHSVLLADRAQFYRQQNTNFGTIPSFNSSGDFNVGYNVINPEGLDRRRALAGFRAVKVERAEFIADANIHNYDLTPDKHQYMEGAKRVAVLGNWVSEN